MRDALESILDVTRIYARIHERLPERAKVKPNTELAEIEGVRITAGDIARAARLHRVAQRALAGIVEEEREDDPDLSGMFPRPTMLGGFE